MRRELLSLAALLLLALLALWGLWSTPGTLDAVLLEPLRLFWGSQQNLSARLLEVSENSEPVKAAGRRLLQPFGMVRLIQVFPGDKPEISTLPAAPGNAASATSSNP